jgi:hypothetical protein
MRVTALQTPLAIHLEFFPYSHFFRVFRVFRG